MNTEYLLKNNRILCFIAGALIIYNAILTTLVLMMPVKHAPDFSNFPSFKATIYYVDRTCYVFEQEIHDRPVDVMICREKMKGDL